MGRSGRKEKKVPIKNEDGTPENKVVGDQVEEATIQMGDPEGGKLIDADLSTLDKNEGDEGAPSGEEPGPEIANKQLNKKKRQRRKKEGTSQTPDLAQNEEGADTDAKSSTGDKADFANKDVKKSGSSRQRAKELKNMKVAQMMEIYNQKKALLDKLQKEKEEQLLKEKEEEERLERERIEKEKAALAKKEIKKQKMQQLKKDNMFMSAAKKKEDAKKKAALTAMMNSGNVFNAAAFNTSSNNTASCAKSGPIHDYKKKKLPSKFNAAKDSVSEHQVMQVIDRQDLDVPKPQDLDAPKPQDLDAPKPQDLDANGKKQPFRTSGTLYNVATILDSSEEEEPPEDWADILESEGNGKNAAVKKYTPTPNADKARESLKAPVTSVPEPNSQSPPNNAIADVEEGISLRSPICCVLGHVDSGKTKLLDKIRQSNVQGGEAGGITQQIGATFFPIGEIAAKTKCLYSDGTSPNYNLPGILTIDTPGHESFTNLRQRGSSMCNIAILVVDILSGFEKQTSESLDILRRAKTPFIVALNKIDRIYGWKTTNYGSSKRGLEDQKRGPKAEFEDRLKKVMLQLSEEGLNSSLSWDNKNKSKYVSIVPISAMTGEGIPDLLDLLVDLSQSKMASKIAYKDEVSCTVLEVKMVEGLGTVIDVILSSGELEENQRIAVCGMTGPIKTTIRSLLTPQPMAELRVKCPFVSHKKVKAALGVRIAAPNLEKAIAGSRVIVLKGKECDDDISVLMNDFNSILNSVSVDKKGVCVQASSLGSLEALITLLKSADVPIIGINIGPVHKKDVIRASATLETAPEYAQLLAFDVPIEKEAQLLADELNVKIFKQNVIYRIFDEYTAYIADMKKEKQQRAKRAFVYPCILEVVPGCVFNKVNPIIIGVTCVEGTLKLDTPICVMDDPKNPVPLGRVVGIEHNHVSKTEVSQGGHSVSIKIESPPNTAPKVFGRHLNEKSLICSHMTYEAIDLFEGIYKDSLKKSDELLLQKLKKMFDL